MGWGWDGWMSGWVSGVDVTEWIGQWKLGGQSG